MLIGGREAAYALWTAALFVTRRIIVIALAINKMVASAWGYHRIQCIDMDTFTGKFTVSVYTYTIDFKALWSCFFSFWVFQYDNMLMGHYSCAAVLTQDSIVVNNPMIMKIRVVCLCWDLYMMWIINWMLSAFL